MDRVILIGLDGANWNLINRMINEGELPGIKFLKENGIFNNLKSTLPPLSPAAWTSIFTGLKPPKHTIWSFVKEKKDSYSIRPISSNDINGEPLWNILSKNNIRSVFVNIPFFYPPNEFDGILITGLGTPSLNSNFTHPTSLKKEILSKFPDYNIDFNEDKILRSEDKSFILENIDRISKSQIEVFKFLFQKEKDSSYFFSIVLRSLDVIQHYFWNDNEILFNFYKQADEFIEWCIKNKNENDTIIICSDHGFRGIKKKIYVNEVLRKLGYLQKKQSTTEKQNTLLPSIEQIHAMLIRMGLKDIIWKLKKSDLLSIFAKILPSETLSYQNEIDWKRTTAYYLQGSSGIININLENRQPMGYITRENYEPSRKKIVDSLIDYKDDESGNNIFEIVSTGENIYSIKENAPDIIIYPTDEYCVKGGLNSHNNCIEMEEKRNGDHSLNGVFIAYGPTIRASKMENEIYVWDISRIILRILRIDALNELDDIVESEII